MAMPLINKFGIPIPNKGNFHYELRKMKNDRTTQVDEAIS